VTGATPGQVRGVLARAFSVDPLMAWIFPDAEHRPEATAAWLGLAVERYLASGQVETTQEDGVLTAVALWRMPGTAGPEADGSLPTAPGLLRALVGSAHADTVAEGFAVVRAQAPPREEPHAYLHFLAVAPGAQGRGLGGRLLENMLARAAETGLPLCLDTTNPANLPFYEAHGLTRRSAVRLGPSGPTMWAFQR
jgi:GNAT superfamily N-acetyltransferase